MSIYLGPDTDPQAWQLVVTDARPWLTPSAVVHRGLGGGTQIVWTAAPPDAGQRFTHRCPAAGYDTLIAALTAPGRVRITTDDPDCPIATGVGVITRVDPQFRYDITPPIVEITIELVWA
jgi:hypothetical protein